jgi:esterase
MLALTTRGEGPRAIALVHGFLGSGRNLASLARRLSESDPALRLVLPDLTGHGTSPPLPPEATLTTLAQDLLEAIPGHFDVIGHSLGGRVALKARTLDPERVGRVTLLDVAPGPIPPVASLLEPVLDALLHAPARAPSREPWRAHFAKRGVSSALIDWLLMNVVNDGESLTWRIDRKALGELHARTRAADLWPDLEAARTPTYVIRGGASEFVSDEDVRRLRDFGCEVDTLADAGHFVHVDAQAELLGLLIRKTTR